MFRQKSYILIFMGAVQKLLLLLHKVVLHYKIIPACNTWHTSTVSDVIKQLKTLTTKVCFSACKFWDLCYAPQILESVD
jgi:hypothetical protein